MPNTIQIKSGTIMSKTFRDMMNRYDAIKENGNKPSKIPLVKNGEKYITLDYFGAMRENYWEGTDPALPNNVTVTNIVNSSQNIGYFIDPDNTPLNGINWSNLKSKGITEVYVRVMNSNYNQFGSVLNSIIKAGLKAYSWIWEGFSYTSFLTLQGWNILMDMETYNMPNYYSEIRGIQNLCKANKKAFILCTKPEGLDGDQKWNIIKDYCDFLMPMLYLNDYEISVDSLVSYMQKYNKLYPGKIYPALETYESDKNVVAKSNSEIMTEVNAVKSYCKGFGLFRYGLSNY